MLIKNGKVSHDALKKFCYGFDLEIKKTLPKGITAMAVNDTLESIKNRKFKCAVFRPLIGYNKEEIENLRNLLKNG